ncbi:CAP domain-containing protein [Alkalihalobacterium chitinilyticum]|uniref:CAP domain-containing protein n=1 Tax=Alkalihalobacterium chitinilyticum TaxID=2980103 RepID=A0ABT5VCA8_9BACI|nr:CAP domain-containing protein [Alkalihalobacterium chitinilyticum]MDE5413096.1 CAP domain-containing protein [Alkalihalobacterium chitinilyticum]
MKRLGCGLFIFLGVLIIILFEYFPDEFSAMLAKVNVPAPTIEDREETGHDQISSDVEVEEEPGFPLSLNEGLHDLIGESSSVIETQFGSPERIDATSYGYDWWVYNDNSEGYLQVGVETDEVVTIFAMDVGEVSKPFVTGTAYDQIALEHPFSENVSLNKGAGSFRFELTEAELLSRPLIQVDEDTWIQLYFDTFTSKLSSVRYLSGDILLKQRPYSVTYRGELPQELELSTEEWREIEAGAELQILDITNVIRTRHNLAVLKWDHEVSKVAYGHSKDMYENQYFSHTSPTYGELKDRLEREGVSFYFAGENIAAQYVDSIEAVEGWLNSEGHRVNLLNEEFTHLGVGVFERYYTQNFMTPWAIH